MRVRLLGFAVVLLAACQVKLPDEGYRCETDVDCGGGGYKCIDVPGKHCCLPDPGGKEICGNNLDDDCDGNVDGQGRVEICNGADDNCDGRTDEGFNLSSDTHNCGSCGHACQTREVCTAGRCVAVVENNCRDGIDNDMNGLTDCADPGCEAEACDVGCVCHAGAKSEGNCNDSVDNDGDGTTDCFDSDCVGKSCGNGCLCKMGGGHAEGNCFDAVDNDMDGVTDCFDPDCLAKPCTPAPLFFTCTAAHQCNCNGGQQMAETGGLCGDGLDNDCNGKTDCAESACDTQACGLDGGTGTCMSLMCR